MREGVRETTERYIEARDVFSQSRSPSVQECPDSSGVECTRPRDKKLLVEGLKRVRESGSDFSVHRDQILPLSTGTTRECRSRHRDSPSAVNPCTLASVSAMAGSQERRSAMWYEKRGASRIPACLRSLKNSAMLANAWKESRIIRKGRGQRLIGE